MKAIWIYIFKIVSNAEIQNYTENLKNTFSTDYIEALTIRMWLYLAKSKVLRFDWKDENSKLKA